MKTLKKLLTLAALVLFAMMFTSCKAKIGGGEFSIFWQILAILMWFIAISQFEYIIPKKQGVFKWICHKFFLVLFLAGIIFPFIWAPLPYIPKISLGVAAFIWLIGMIKGAPIKKQKELEKAYSGPYVAVEAMLKDIVSIIDGPYKKAKTFVDSAEKSQKKNEIMRYAMQKASEYGDVGRKIIESPAFFNNSWANKSTSVKSIHDSIDSILNQAVMDVNSIQATGGDNTAVLMARYFETLSMDDVKSFKSSLSETDIEIDSMSVESENNVLGYKILKITATEDQMASIMDQLEIMGVEVEEIEDGMPKAMEELVTPDFDSFVAFASSYSYYLRQLHVRHYSFAYTYYSAYSCYSF